MNPQVNQQSEIQSFVSTVFRENVLKAAQIHTSFSELLCLSSKNEAMDINTYFIDSHICFEYFNLPESGFIFSSVIKQLCHDLTGSDFFPFLNGA